MIYARVLLLAFIVLAVIYYIMVIGQLFGKWKITNREIKFSCLCIPFYYWMVSQEEKKAESVSEDVEIIYKRRIEDLCHRIRNYDRDRENILLDLSPSSLTSGAVVPSDFDATKFMEKDVEIGLNKRDAIIQLEIVLDRYEYLFGPLADTTAVLKVLPEWKSKLVQ